MPRKRDRSARKSRKPVHTHLCQYIHQCPTVVRVELLDDVSGNLVLVWRTAPKKFPAVENISVFLVQEAPFCLAMAGRHGGSIQPGYSFSWQFINTDDITKLGRPPPRT